MAIHMRVLVHLVRLEVVSNWPMPASTTVDRDSAPRAEDSVGRGNTNRKAVARRVGRAAP